MKTSAIIFLFVLVTFSSCKKEDELMEVVFVIRETSAATPLFNITYTADQTGGSNVASNNDNYWASDKLMLEKEQFVSLKTECTDPLFDLTLNIYVNGNLWKSEQTHNPTPSYTISGNLPND